MGWGGGEESLGERGGREREKHKEKDGESGKQGEEESESLRQKGRKKWDGGDRESLRRERQTDRQTERQTDREFITFVRNLRLQTTPHEVRSKPYRHGESEPAKCT